VEALDLAAGLRVVGGGVLGDDAQSVELGLEQDPSLAGLAAEDGGVVGEEGGGPSELVGAAEERLQGIGCLDRGEGDRCDKEA